MKVLRGELETKLVCTADQLRINHNSGPTIPINYYTGSNNVDTKNNSNIDGKRVVM